MTRRKFFYTDAVRFVQGDRRLHHGHVGQVTGTTISIFPTYRHTTYTVSCECGSVIRVGASDMEPLEGAWHGIAHARIDYWFRNQMGIPPPTDAEAQLAEGLSLLSDREREILTSRCGWQGRDHKALSELGQDFGVTRERIRQIEFQAHKKIRVHLQTRSG